MQQTTHATHLEMAQYVEQLGVYKVKKTTTQLIAQAILAGVFIAIGFMFYITVTTGNQSDFGINRLIGGVCFSLGLILVLLCGAELFTSTLLTFVPFASKKITLPQMVRCWTWVFIGNGIGAIIFAIVVWLAQEHQVANGAWGLSVLKIAEHKLHHTFISAVTLGLLCNLLVCLAVWMGYAGKTLLEKAMLVILPVAMFVACGFEHSIANLFIVPLAIFIQQFAEPAFWQSISSSAAQFSDINWLNFVQHNLFPVVIGNILGAAVLAYPQWYLHLRAQPKAQKHEEAPSVTLIEKKTQLS